MRVLEVASAMTPPAAAVEPEYDVAAIGTWNWHANSRGLHWFADEVIPRLPDGLTVAIAGRGADWLAGRHPNVRVHGVVPDARDFMAAARVVACPSVTGGGIQLKTLDAVACGVPVVATEVATRGIDDPPGTVTVASDPEAFAAELARLAATSDRHAARAEAEEWSQARRRRFDAAVTGWLAEAAGAPRTVREPAGVAERSSARLA